MNAEAYFLFQFQRLLRYETKSRQDIEVQEEDERCNLREHRAQGVLQIRETERLESTKEATSNSTLDMLSATAKRHLVGFSLHGMQRPTICIAWNNFFDDETTCRKDIDLWQEREWDAVCRSTRLQHIATQLDNVLGEETCWREKIDLEMNSQFSAATLLHLQTSMFLLQEQHVPGSEPYLRQLLTSWESLMRWNLAIDWCCLGVMWDEWWNRVKIRAAQHMEQMCMTARFQLQTHECQEWSVIVALGRPAIDDALDILAEEERKRQHDMAKLRLLHQVRMCELQRMAEFNARRDDFVLQQKMDLMESILSIQDGMLVEVAQYDDHSPDALSRIKSQMDEDRTWVVNPETPFGLLREYQERLLRLREEDDPIRVRAHRSSGQHAMMREGSSMREYLYDAHTTQLISCRDMDHSFLKPVPTAQTSPPLLLMPPVESDGFDDGLDAAYEKIMSMV